VIHVDHHPLPVRRNLHTFLTQMAVEKRLDWFFVDAICIDQDNELEKTCQVQQMGDVYL
jgi:hypothetical protein